MTIILALLIQPLSLKLLTFLHYSLIQQNLSMLFVLTEKIEYKNEFPLLSARDVREIIVQTYAQQDNVLEIMMPRHKRR